MTDSLRTKTSVKTWSAVLLLSSGLDSAAQFVLTSEEHFFDVKLALTVDYGQRGADAELLHAQKLAHYFGIEHIAFSFKQFSSLIGSKGALLNTEEAVPRPATIDERQSPNLIEHLHLMKQTAKAVWVPNRNGILLSLAAALAESRQLDAVAVGFNAEEAVTFADNTVEFMDAMTKAFRFSTLNQVRVVSATSHLNKTQIVQKLSGQDFPFHLLWSCYENGPAHCGQCESCQRLKRALSQGLSVPFQKDVLNTLFGEK